MKLFRYLCPFLLLPCHWRKSCVTPRKPSWNSASVILILKSKSNLINHGNGSGKFPWGRLQLVFCSRKTETSSMVPNIMLTNTCKQIMK